VHRPVVDLSIRTYAGSADDRLVAELLRTANLFDGTDLLPSDEQIANEFTHPGGFVPTEDSFLGELGGRVVAVGEVRYVRRDDEHTFDLSGSVRPDCRRQGVGAALLARLETRATERAATLSAGPIWLDASAPELNLGFAALVEAAGYTPIRTFVEMIRRDLDEVVQPPLPAGLELSPVVAADLRKIYDAEAEAFRDHWGQRDWSDENFARMVDEPDLDLGLWRVAWDGDEIAGVVAAWIIAEENAALGLERGWLEQISVRRPWRRRGLAAALILSACAGLRERGMTEVALGVDSTSLTGAFELYERLGFQILRRITTWRRALGRKA
jgi:mycothiol synthase